MSTENFYQTIDNMVHGIDVSDETIERLQNECPEDIIHDMYYSFYTNNNLSAGGLLSRYSKVDPPEDIIGVAVTTNVISDFYLALECLESSNEGNDFHTKIIAAGIPNLCNGLALWTPVVQKVYPSDLNEELRYDSTRIISQAIASPKELIPYFAQQFAMYAQAGSLPLNKRIPYRYSIFSDYNIAHKLINQPFVPVLHYNPKAKE